MLAKLDKSELKLYQEKAEFLKALAHPTRLWMATKLLESEKCVCEFVNAMDYDFSTISKHLSVLKNAKIVESEKRGKQVYYKLITPCVLDSMTCVNKVLKK